MKLVVLGAGAGGGLPQWNCACANCTAAREGAVSPRTQASLAVSADGESWILLGVSPDVRAQLQVTPALWPRAARHSPIVGAAIPNGDLDAWIGLLSLREWTPLTLMATPPVRDDLLANPVMRTLSRFEGHSRWAQFPATLAGLTIEAIPVPGKVPVHMMGHRAPDSLDNVGFVVRDQRKSIAWFPSVGGPTRELERALTEVDVIFFDGTFSREDELPGAREMAHWPVSESRDWLAKFSARKFWVHVNNTNPLREDVPADGMELEL
jgi:pyrroloquinoline quinone biosynthesis protein B